MKIKLLTVFLLAISAIVLVGYISYEGLSKLMTSLESTTRPDFRKDHFNKLIYSLSEAENSIRVYTITRESKYLEPFYSSVNEIDHQMEILFKYAKGDPYFETHLDSLHRLIEKKIEIQKNLIELKEDISQINVYQHVLEKIQSIEKKNEELDSLENELVKIDSEEKQPLAETEEPEETKEKRGFFRRLFSSNKKEEEEKPVEEEVAEVAPDTTSQKTDSLALLRDTLRKEKISTRIESSLVEIKTKEEEQSKNLTEAELALTKKDQEISEFIKLEVAQVEKYFDSEKIKTAEQAAELFDDTTRLIKVVGTVSAMLFLVLIFIILNDIQVNQRFRRRLENAKKRAEDLAAAKEDFLSNMSHEIRTPLNAIVGFTEQLSDSPSQQSQQKYLRIVKNASQHLLSIINDILDYNKLEAGKIKIEKAPFSVAENAKIVYDTLLINAHSKSLSFNLKTDDFLRDHLLLGDAVRFRQILFNLAGNAIKFTDSGTVDITLVYKNQKLKPCLEITVKDSGIGMSEKEVEIIFNKFDQADQSISKKYGGTGLGLSIVKKLVDLQRGTIRVKSKQSLGSLFIVHLPLPITENVEVFPTTTAPPEQNSLNGKRVLIVDDEEYNVLLFETILKKHKAQTHTASSGEQSLQLLKENEVDLVLLDLQMKGMDGFQTISKIKEQINTQVPVIAITASVSRATHKKCKESGFLDVILKPINEKDFMSVMARHMTVSAAPERESVTKNTEDTVPDHLKHVFELVQNDGGLAINMIGIYLKNISAAKESFIKGISENDFDEVTHTAHKVIPSSRHMGFEELAARLKFVENNCGTANGLKTHKKLVEDICGDIDDIVHDLNEFLDRYKKDQKTVIA